MYNIIFAKNELMFDDFKIAVVLDIFWKLLEFDPDDSADKKKDNLSYSDHLKKEPDVNTITPQKEMDAKDHKMFPYQMNNSSNYTSNQKSDNNGIQYRGEGIDFDQELQDILNNKFQLFRGLIMKHVHMKNPALKLNK